MPTNEEENKGAETEFVPVDPDDNFISKIGSKHKDQQDREVRAENLKEIQMKEEINGV